MTRIVNLTVGDPSLDPRARRVADAAREAGVTLVSVGLGTAHASARSPRLPRELRGAARLARTARRTVALLRKTRHLAADIVHTHDLDALVAGWVLSRRRGARLVYDAHELYTGFDADPPRLWLALARRLEGSIARRAGAVVTVSDEIADELARRYRLERKPIVVLNCPATDAGEPETHTGPLRAIYQAAAGPGRDLHDLPAVDGVELHARVLGRLPAPSYVTLHEPVPPDDLVSALRPFDIGLVIDRPETDNSRLALPNKLFEYLMAGLAVVVPDVPAMAQLVQREGIGRTYEPGRLGEVLAELAQSRAQVEGMRQRARQAALERYNAEAQRPALLAAWGL